MTTESKRNKMKTAAVSVAAVTVFRISTLLKRLLFLILAGVIMRGELKADDSKTNSVKDQADLSLEQLVNIQVDSVFGASKYEQKVTRAPASVNIVTSDDIKKFGYRTLVDVLRSTAGVYVTDRRDYARIGIRGSGDAETGVLLLVDGHRINDNILNVMNLANGAVVDVDMIERVEIIRGPSSSIYGNSAFFGVINVITKRGRDIDGAEASVEGGSFDTYKGSFTYGKKFTNDVELALSGTYYSSG